jgi:hypothetical protein
MNCPHCGYPNPNGYTESCKSCRKPLTVAPVVEKKPEVAKVAKVAKTTKKAKATKKA